MSSKTRRSIRSHVKVFSLALPIYVVKYVSYIIINYIYIYLFMYRMYTYAKAHKLDF